MKGSTKVFLSLGIAAYIWFGYFTFFMLTRYEIRGEGTNWEYSYFNPIFGMCRVFFFAIPGLTVYVLLMVYWDNIIKWLDKTF